MLLILSPQTSPRLDYVCQVIFEHVLGLEYNITEDEEKYKAHTDFKLRYVPKPSSFLRMTFGSRMRNRCCRTSPHWLFICSQTTKNTCPTARETNMGGLCMSNLLW